MGGNKYSIYKSGKVTLQEYRLWCAAEAVGVSALFDRVAHHVLLWLANSAAPEVLCEPVTGGADSDLHAGSLWHRGSKVAGETACICSSMLVKNEKCLNRFSGSTCMCDIWLNEVSSNWIMSRAIFFLPNFVHALSGMCVVWHKTHTWTWISYNFKSWNTHLANKLGFFLYNNVVRKHLRIKKKTLRLLEKCCNLVRCGFHSQTGDLTMCPGSPDWLINSGRHCLMSFATRLHHGGHLSLADPSR